MSGAATVIFVVGRVLFSVLFFRSARSHVMEMARYRTLATGRLPFPVLAAWPTGLYLVLASASIDLGVWPDIGALMLVVFLIPTTMLFHPFWKFTDPAQRGPQTANFARNVSLAGAALCLFAVAVTAMPATLTGSLIHLR